jgi:hypothetical protein
LGHDSSGKALSSNPSTVKNREGVRASKGFTFELHIST